MRDFIYWFLFWKKPKSMSQAVFQGLIGGLVFSLVIFAPLWLALLAIYRQEAI